jgi:hypothetical protein
MAEFKGGNKVRCADCTKLSGKTCTAKSTTVSVKKRRSCGQYNFAGEYVNSTPLPATYVPHVDKKTKQLMKKLMKMGVLPATGQRPAPTIKSEIYEQEKAPINPAAFQSTATAQIPIVKPLESHGEAAVMRTEGDESQEGTTVVWSPEDAENVEEK